MSVSITIHGITTTRPTPINPNSYRCGFGFHNMKPVVFGEMSPNFVLGSGAFYCSVCNHLDPGKIVNGRLISEIEKAKRLLEENGYTIHRL